MEKRSSTFNASSDGWESDDEHEDGGGLKENFKCSYSVGESWAFEAAGSSDESCFELDLSRFGACLDKKATNSFTNCALNGECSSVSAVAMEDKLSPSHEKQDVKINSLELNQVESRSEIQLPKARLNALERQLFERSGKVEREESESRNDSHPSLEESVLLVGGYDGSSWLSAIDCYQPSLGYMESRSSTRLVHKYASAVNLNGEVYVFGGENKKKNVWCDEVESYNPVSNEWTSCPSLNQKKGYFAGVSFNEKIYATGGVNTTECYSAVEIFDVNREKWIHPQSMLHKRHSPADAEIKGTIYVVEGYDGKNCLKSVERFDPRECSWTRLKSMSTRRAFHSLSVLNEKLFAVGGFDDEKVLSTVEVLDPRCGSWMMEDSMNNCQSCSAAVVVGDTIYVSGGLSEKAEALDTVKRYKEGLGWQSTKSESHREKVLLLCHCLLGSKIQDKCCLL
ncbi:BTB-kelch protein [Trema orientale]|uniref:BTB-kelch protein n=1 Tax=Trema orientale TaxID=63057 RepID=A0A2P5E5U0_TREOI|nr:BTB-kelch protein [Trema orientale]